jgi:hypothetical protein
VLLCGGRGGSTAGGAARCELFWEERGACGGAGADGASVMAPDAGRCGVRRPSTPLHADAGTSTMQSDLTIVRPPRLDTPPAAQVAASGELYAWYLDATASCVSGQDPRCGFVVGSPVCHCRRALACLGAWARVTMDRFKHSALQTF